jgi:hypothetical protein
MRFLAGCLFAILATTNLAIAQKAKPKPRVAAKPAPLIPEPLYLEAFKEVTFCGGQSEDPSPSKCDSTWRGIRWKQNPSGYGEINPEVGTSWTFRCRYDEVENEDRCQFYTGDQFALSFIYGKVWLNWGTERYPGSEMVARFDDGSPVSTSEKDGWPFPLGALLLRRMMAGRIMYYRWSDWPGERNRDGRIDLTGFSDVAALMRAITSNYTAARVTGKVK